MTLRWRLLENWEPGAVHICVGEYSEQHKSPDGSMIFDTKHPSMRWAKLQYRPADTFEYYWQDVPIE